jgi:hypothetical protein
MASMIDQIRASKLPSNMMQFAARGALQVSAAENIEILVHLALHNKVFGELAKMTLAGWDEKASLAAATDPQTPKEVLGYLISPDNVRPKLLPALLENPSVSDNLILKFTVSASRESIEAMLKSDRVRGMAAVLKELRSNPYLKKEEADELRKLTAAGPGSSQAATDGAPVAAPAGAGEAVNEVTATESADSAAEIADAEADPAADEVFAAYLAEHAAELAAEGDKPFQAIGGIVELLGADYFPVTQVVPFPGNEVPTPAPAAPAADAAPLTALQTATAAAAARKAPAPAGVRENALQKINRLDIKGRIQLALKGNKEERSLLIRDGTKLVAFAVLEAPKLSDGEVEKFASQKNVLEAVLRQIPMKRRFMKNYIVVRNLVANPRTPLDLGLGLMKNLMIADLKNLSGNKDVSDTIRKLALKNYKQKLEAANKK